MGRRPNSTIDKGTKNIRFSSETHPHLICEYAIIAEENKIADNYLLFSNQSFMASWTAFRKAPFFPPNLLTTSNRKLCSSSSSILTFNIPTYDTTNQQLYNATFK